MKFRTIRLWAAGRLSFISVAFVWLAFVSTALIFASSFDLQSYFSPKGGTQEAIIRAILAAEKTIDIAMYSFSSDRILDTFRRLKKERPGVRIRMIFNDADNEVSKEEGDKPQAERAREIERSGIDVRYVTRGNKRIMHEKFMIVDGIVLLNGSGNFSNSSDSRYDENMIEHRLFKEGEEALSLFQEEFDLMWNLSYDFPDGSRFRDEPKKEHVRKFKDANVIPYFTSANFDPAYTFPRNGERTVSRALERAIESARSSIYVATGHFRLMLLANALIRAKKSHPDLDIRVVLDSQEYVAKERHEEHLRRYRQCIREYGVQPCELVGGYELSRYLSQNGIDVRLKYYSFLWHYPFEPQMHHKYMIVDKREVWTGSYNWSRNAEFNSFENVVCYRGDELQPLISRFLENFNRLWELNRDQYRERERKLREENLIEIHFGGKSGEGAMALTISEIDRLREILEEEIPGFFRKARREDRYWDKKRDQPKEAE
jgi:phosphatidylserine/phosphatidylglycerophosphate/cardiolipin synthase-like enzyme